MYSSKLKVRKLDNFCVDVFCRPDHNFIPNNDHQHKFTAMLMCLTMKCYSCTEWSINTGTKSAVQILHEFVHLCPVGVLEYKLSECRK